MRAPLTNSFAASSATSKRRWQPDNERLRLETAAGAARGILPKREKSHHRFCGATGALPPDGNSPKSGSSAGARRGGDGRPDCPSDAPAERRDFRPIVARTGYRGVPRGEQQGHRLAAQPPPARVHGSNNERGAALPTNFGPDGIAAGIPMALKWLLRSLLLFTLLSSGAAAVQANPPTAEAGAGAEASAIFAGGCFWCVEADFETLGGVQRVESGYTGGHVPQPTYEQVSEGGTGHAEAVRVWFDPAKISYAQLLAFFWHHIDPTVKDRQFCDVGHQYRSAIFYLDENQRRIAEASKAALEQSGKLPHVYTEITAAGPFYPAEKAHQNYHSKNPLRYKFYRLACGRDARVAAVWGSN